MSLEPPPPVRFLLNGELVRSDVPPWRGVLDHLRRDRRVLGVREGCREGDCGACTVLLGELERSGRVRYRPASSCLLLVPQLEGRHLVTIEGLTPREGLSPLQRIVLEEGATQCGFCTPGILVAWTAWLLDGEETADASASEREAIAAISGNLCRCTGYASLRRSARRIREELAGALERPPAERVDALIEAGVLPAHFREAPAHLAELAAKAPKRGEPDPSAPVLAGGTDRLVRHREPTGGVAPRLVPLAGRVEAIREEGAELVLDAATTFDDLARSAPFRRLVPRVREHLELVASPPIRARATLGGNIANASPAADLGVMLLALDAELELHAMDGARRRLALAEFHQGYKRTALREGEVIERLRLPLRARAFGFEKVSRRRWLDVAAVNSAISVELDGDRFGAVTLAVGGVAPVPLRLSRAASALEGAPIGPEAIRAAADLQDEEIAPISDVRGSATYKRLLARRLLYAHFLTLLPGRGLEELAR